MDNRTKNTLALTLPVLGLIIISFVIYWALIYRKTGISTGLLAEEIQIADFGWCLLASALSLGLIMLFVKSFPMKRLYDENVRLLADSFSMKFLALYFIPNAFYEELIFRGSLIPVIGLIPSTLLFTVVHVTYLKKPLLTIEVFLQGIILGGLFMITGSVWITTIAHTALNTIQMWLIKTDKIIYRID